VAHWPTELQRVLAALTTDAANRAVPLMAHAAEFGRRESLAFITDAFPEFITPFIAGAGDIAATIYEDLPGGIDGYTAFTADPPPLDKLAAAGRYALLRGIESFIEGMLTRLINNGFRDTTFENIAKEYGEPVILEAPGAVLGTLWARHASANACGFCRVLATRGAVYHSEESATRVIGESIGLTITDKRRLFQEYHVGSMAELRKVAPEAIARERERRQYYTSEKAARKAGKHVGDRKVGRLRGTQDYGDKFHDKCHCTAIAVRPGGHYEPAPYVRQWEADHEQAINDAQEAGELTGGRDDIKVIARRMDQIERDRRNSDTSSNISAPDVKDVRDDDAPATDSAADDGGNGTGNGTDRTGFGSPDEFPKLPDGSSVPYGPSDVAPLDSWDFDYFAGKSTQSGGGHRYGSKIDGKTEFAQWVQSLDDLQAIQDAALTSPSVRVYPAGWGRYQFRSAVNVRGHAMVVHVVLDAHGYPVTIFPVNGDGVGRNVGGRREDRPFDLDALLNWTGDDH